MQKCKLNTHAAAKKRMEADPDWYDEKYDNVMDLPLTEIMDVIAAVDDKTLSLPNQRAVKSAGVHISKAYCEHIIEFITGYGVADLKLVGALRHRGFLMKMLKYGAAVRGNRGATLRLPPKWDASGQGIWSAVALKGRIHAVENASEKTHALKNSSIPAYKTVEDLYFVHNHSEKNVVLKSRRCPEFPGLSMTSLGASHIVDKTLKPPSRLQKFWKG